MAQGYHVPVRSACLLAAALVGCGGDTRPGTGDGGVEIDAPTGTLPTTCTGACATTALTADFEVTRTLDKSYFGINSDDDTLRVEAYRRAGTGCPTMNSPTPDYTLIIGRLPKPTGTGALESPANILDFRGDLLGGPLGVAATMRTITPAAYNDRMLIALDVMLTFNEGTVMGHLYATHCPSLDQ